MNALDVLTYGNLTLLKTLDRLPAANWNDTGVCGVWSAKDVIAHLASYEVMLVEILSGFIDSIPTPLLDQFRDPNAHFNDEQVRLRAAKTHDEVLNEYKAAHQRVLALTPQIPAETWRETGELPWYGDAYSLEDFIVYTYYGHKREHSAQIAAFCDQFAQP
ncbi:MAG: DinB family protein [Aggregatilineales bacterium]